MAGLRATRWFRALWGKTWFRIYALHMRGIKRRQAANENR